ncbi:sensor histidine kinase [Nocardioides dongkuii]|uniref:sensor histidine kinase n=1 Tax=Nocardioides dongkuii TaxID=2760089 RepID=UPI0015F9651B|nr:ATP-binding protein [Nocardioides dongkuii]
MKEGRTDGSLFRKLLDAAPDATVIVDQDATIVMSNKQMENVFGWTSEDLVGQPVEVLVPGRFRGNHDAYRNGFMSTPASRPINGVALHALRRDGQEVPVEISLSPLETDEGLLVSAAVRDITERLRMEEASVRMRDELIATVSHELRTPLTSIIGYTELLADLDESQVGPVARSLVAVIERNAAREMRLVDDLLTMAFLDGDRLRIVREPMDLAEVARRVVTDHRSAAPEGSLRLVLEADEPAPVSGDFYRLVQVVENLVTNALKFSAAGDEVTVRVTATPDAAVLEVADTGVGLHPHEQALVFDRLYRTPGAVAAHTQGAGLGLSIVRKIIEAHGGQVTVDSAPGVGTTFRVALPYDAPDPA